MRIHVTPTSAHIEGRVPLEAMAILHDTLRYREPGYFHDPRFKWHKWDGWQPLWLPKDLRFPAGLVGRVREQLTQGGVAVEVHETDSRLPIPEVSSTLPDGTVLYLDQQRALSAALQQQRGLMELATNFGKTELIAALCAAWPDERALIITPQRSLVQQTAGRLRTRLGGAVAEFPGGTQTATVIVATIQGLAYHLRHQEAKTRAFLQRVRLLLIDEAHKITVTQWFPVLGACPAPVRLGFSGSLEEARVPILSEAYLGPVFHQVGEQALIREGRSARMDVIMPYVASAIPESQDFDAQYVPMIVRNDARNQLLTEMLARGVTQGWPGLALFFRHEHGDALQALLMARGISAALAHGGIAPLHAERQVRDFAEGRYPILLAGHAYAAGIDLPRVRLVVNAGAWKSPLVTRQKQGRGMRRKPEGENRVVLGDPYDLGNTILKRHAETRRRSYAKRLTTEPRVGTLDEIWKTLFVDSRPVTV